MEGRSATPAEMLGGMRIVRAGDRLLRVVLSEPEAAALAGLVDQALNIPNPVVALMDFLLN